MTKPKTAKSADDVKIRQQRLERYQRQVARCRLCVEAGYLGEALPIYHGTASSRVMVVGQAPAAPTIELELPFSGATGQTLQGWLARAGFRPGALHDGFYLTSLTKCFPGSRPSGKGDRAPSKSEIALCTTHLERELELVRPELILPLGRLAISFFTGTEPLTELVGKVHRRGEAFVLPLPHPSGLSRWLNDPEHQALLDAALSELSDLREELGLAGS